MSQNKPNNPTEYERIMQMPGALWRLSMMVKEVPNPDGSLNPIVFFLGFECDRDISADHAQTIVDMAQDYLLTHADKWKRLPSGEGRGY